MLHVILLENENVILFESENIYDYQIMNECVDKCDFAKEHPPLGITEKIQITEPVMVDYYVKNYMQHYGINHVRGGSYVNVTPEQYENLQNEFNHADTVKLLESLKYFVHDDTRYMIDRKVIESIEWLSDTIKLKSSVSEYKQKYTEIICEPFDLVLNRENFYMRYKQLLVYLVALSEKIPLVKNIEYGYASYLANPAETFNKFINVDYCVSDDDILIAKKLCDYYEYATYCIINKCDELEFDINN